MYVAVPKEMDAGERRVALTPEVVGKLVAKGLAAGVQRGAGEGSGHPDVAYAEAGAALIATAPELWAAADVVVKVRRPADEEVALARPGSVLIGLLQPLAYLALAQRLAERGVIALSLDLLPRTSRAQGMDVLSSMATIAGYRAVLLGATMLPKLFPLLMTAAGVLAPARVLVLGVGVAGLQAIATARRLGAQVEAFDTRAAAREQAESLGARVLTLPAVATNAEGAGGYAEALAAEQEVRERALVADHVAGADVVVATAQVPGGRAPLLIAADTVARMRPGSVIVDLAAESGGNCALTVPGQDVVRAGVVIVGRTNLPSEAAVHASQLFAGNVFALLDYLLPDGAAKIALDGDDPIVAGLCVARDGRVIHPAVVAALGRSGAAVAAIAGRDL